MRRHLDTRTTETLRPDSPSGESFGVDTAVDGAWNPATLKRFVRRLGKSSADCEDIVQDAYLRLLETSKQGRPIGSPLGYLLVVARNLVTDAGRRAAREQKRMTALRALRSQLNPSEPSAEELAFVAQAQERLGKALSELPPRIRRVYVLHRFRAQPHKEIAKRLGITTRTVERDIAAALAHLKDALFQGESP